MAVLAIHPGEHLAEELKALDMSVAVLARRLQVAANRHRSITGDTALRLAKKKAGRAIKALPTLETERIRA